MCSTGPYETIEIGKYRLDIFTEEGARDPYKDMDGLWPMIVNGGRNGADHDYKNASDALIPTEEQYRQHKDALIAAAEYHPDPELSEEQTMEEVMDEIRQAIKSHDVKVLEKIADALEVPCLRKTSNGYSQSSYAYCLVVFTEAWAKELGKDKAWANSEEGQKSMQAGIDLWGAWAWGDVFHYALIDTTTGEELDRCSGFYGSDHEESGLMESVREAISCAEEEQRKARAKKVSEHIRQVKGWIKNHVPVIHRHPLQF